MIQGFASLPELVPLQRAKGCGRISVGLRGLERLYQEGCAKIRLPRGGGLEGVLINTSGGLTGGDRLEWDAKADDGSALTLTTQACEKVYRARDGRAETRVSLTVGDGARIDWLPQETIVFDGGALDRRLDVDLAADGRLLALEAVVLGRTAMGETVRVGEIADRWRVRRGGHLMFADDLRFAGPIEAIGVRRATLNGARTFASILLVAEDASRFLPTVRAALGELGGASAFDGKLFARLVAPDGFELRRRLLPTLEILRDGAPLPRVWRT